MTGRVATPGYGYGVAVTGSRALIADWDRGLQVAEITTPASPAPLGRIDTPGSAQDLVIRDGLAYVADDDHSLAVIDLADPAAPALVFQPARARTGQRRRHRRLG